MPENNRQIKELRVYPEWCKGCGICAEFCPKGVLEVKKQVAIAHPEQCVKCGICEKLCPDYVLYFVSGDQEEKDDNA